MNNNQSGFTGKPITSIIHNATEKELIFRNVFGTFMSGITFFVFFVVDYTRWFDPNDYKTKLNFLKWLKENEETMHNAKQRVGSVCRNLTIITLDDGTDIDYDPTDDIKWSIHFNREYNYECIIYNTLSLLERRLCKNILKELDNIVS